MLRASLGNGLRLWCNGQLVFQTDVRLNVAHHAVRIPVTLKAGRNAILVRAPISTPRPINLRIADTPADRAITLAEQGRWRDAVEVAFSTRDHGFPNDPVWFESTFTQIALMLGDHTVLEREGERLLTIALSRRPLWDRIWAAEPLLLVDHSLRRQHGPALSVAFAELLQAGSLGKLQPSYLLRLLAHHAVFEGQIDEASRLLREDPGMVGASALWAMIHHAQGDSARASAFLESSFQEAKSVGSQQWFDHIIVLSTLRQAERRVTGGEARFEQLMTAWQAAAADKWQNIDPSTADYDHAVDTYRVIRFDHARPAFPYLARARRLAELGRMDDAVADFHKAVELAPNDVPKIAAWLWPEPEDSKSPLGQLIEAAKPTQPEPASLTQPDAANLPQLPPSDTGFVNLFDGKTLNGWQGDKSAYVVNSGLLIAHQRGNLFTTQHYSDFILQFEFRLDRGANNGVAIRSPLSGDPAYEGFEIQILDDSSVRNLPDHSRNGSIWGVAAAKPGRLNFADQWNHQEIKCVGPSVQVTLNGMVILNVDLDTVAKPADGRNRPGLTRKSGYIGFMSDKPRVEFRNIRIKEIRGS